MNDEQTERLIHALERIATAMEQPPDVHTNHDAQQVDRMLAVQERQVALAEEHVQLHREQGLRPPEGKVQ